MARHTSSRDLKTLSIKVPRTLSARVARLAKSRGTTVSEVVREAIAQFTPDDEKSFAESARAFIGIGNFGPGDLATNKRHLKKFGK